MNPLKLLVAARDPNKSLALESIVRDDISNQGSMSGVNIHVELVSTLAMILHHAPDVSAIILLDLALEDATIDVVVDAIQQMPEPVVVITEIIDPAVLARCKLHGATVLSRATARHEDLCSVIIRGLCSAVVNAVQTTL